MAISRAENSPKRKALEGSREACKENLLSGTSIEHISVAQCEG